MAGLAMKIQWASDWHLDFVEEPVETLHKLPFDCDLFVFCGDLANGDKLFHCMDAVLYGVPCKFAFVHGNHEFYKMFYRTTLDYLRKKAANNPKYLLFLEKGVIEPLSEKAALCGISGWYDMRAGERVDTKRDIMDVMMISDFFDREERIENMAISRHMADRAAAEAKETLLEAIKTYDEILFVTHYPPYSETAFHLDGLSPSNSMPYFCSVAMGQAIDEVFLKNPDKKITVLCGHTHTGGFFRRSPNIEVHVAHSVLHRPEIQARSFEF